MTVEVNIPEGERCEEILARLRAKGEAVQKALEITGGDVERMHNLWRSIPEDEKRRIVRLAVEKLYLDPITAQGLREAAVTREFLEKHLYEMTDKVCRGAPGDELNVVTLLGAVNAVMLGIELSTLLGAVSLIGSKIASNSPDVETALSVTKVYLWCVTMLTENYTSIREAVLSRASGISEQVMRNLVRAYSSDLKQRITRFLSGGGRA